jgi:predicted ATPase
VEPQVFICHSSVDARTAGDICARLEANGIRCWIAPRDPVPGMPWSEQIVNAISAVAIVLLVFSRHANESEPVLNEIELALNRRKKILLVRIEDVAPSSGLEFYVRRFHWFDAVKGPLDQIWSELVRDVQILVGQPAPAVSAAPAEAPPSGSNASNLSSQPTSFVGREHDVAEIKKLLAANHLVTLVGSGGAGKTRTATQVGAALLDSFPGGVWLVEFGPISDGSLVPATVARTLGVTESADRPLLDSLLEYLKERRLLLILDNCEHVIDDVRTLAGAIVRSCPEVRILATSRESLNITAAGEHVFRLPSLAVPPSGMNLKAKAALRYGGVALFRDRALAANGRFAVSDDNAPFVGEICRRLDGIPLAIELAAARITVLSPQQLAQRLDERFRVLTGGDRSALPRHQTMRALIDWSYDLLLEQERALFRKVSIFANGFTLQGAAQVCGDEGCDELAVLDLLSSLVDKSLLQTDPGSEDRYRLLESTRQYAREKLAESGEFELSARRHLEYLIHVFDKAGAEYEATMSSAATSGLAVELEDARSALDWGEQHALSKAVDLYLASRLWVHLGLNREGIDRAKRLIALVAQNDSVRLARLCSRIAVSAGRIGHHASAKEAADVSMRYARASSDPETLADCLLTYADVIAHDRRFDEAEAALDEAEASGTPTPRRRMQALHTRGLIASIRGDLETAARCFGEVRELYASVGNDVGVVSAVLNLAEMEHARGATSTAVEIALSGISPAERLPNRGDWAFLMRNLAGYLNAINDVSGAREAASKAIAFYSSHDPEGPFTAIALEHLALSLAIEGNVQTAAPLEGYIEKTLTDLGFEREYTELTSHERLMDILRKSLAQDQLAILLARGERMQAHEALAGAVNAERD